MSMVAPGRAKVARICNPSSDWGRRKAFSLAGLDDAGQSGTLCGWVAMRLAAYFLFEKHAGFLFSDQNSRCTDVV